MVLAGINRVIYVPFRQVLILLPDKNRKSRMTPHTLTIPEAGKRYFDLSRNASYAAAKRGEIPTIRIGKLLRVPVRALEAKLDATMKPGALS
jgi:hypothetical protein